MAKKNDNDDGQESARDLMGRFAAGNKFSEGLENSGRPPAYTSVDQFRNRAEEYIERTKVKSSGAYKPTLTGLVYHLGFESLQSFYDYEKRPEFSYTVKRLRTFIQSCYEQQLYSFAWAGAAFALKNLGKEDWKDEVVQQQNQTVTEVTIVEKKRED